MVRSPAALKKDIEFELRQIEHVVSSIDQIESRHSAHYVTACGAYLMNFYNGVENILKRCAKEHYRKSFAGEYWHKSLLRSAAHPPSGKARILRPEVVDKLAEYLSFRHLFIHGYGFKLDASLMRPLVDNVDQLWQDVRRDVETFLTTL